MPQDVQTTSRPSPDVMRGVIPHLSLDGRSGEAADFYMRAFGAADLGRMPDPENPDRLMHVQLEVNGGSLMLTDCRAPWETGERAPRGFNLTLVVSDGDFWWNRAVSAGCELVMPFEKMFWGERWGLLRDPFGIEWGIDEPGPES